VQWQRAVVAGSPARGKMGRLVLIGFELMGSSEAGTLPVYSKAMSPHKHEPFAIFDLLEV